MKKIVTGIIYSTIIIVILSLFLYPTLSAYFNSKSQSRVVSNYFDGIAALDDGELRSLLERAHEYNANLLYKTNRFERSAEDTEEYLQQLNTNHEIMGVLAIDKINVKLPIYHGTSEGVLMAGLGHFQGSSLPVGGIGTHSVITGHRGLPSSTLLTSLDKMTEGDTFTLYVMGEALTYQVDQILTVEPDNVQSLGIDSDKDYCTLVTCTPYGINTHRLLVRGHRVDTSSDTGWNANYADAKKLDKAIIILIFMIPVTPILIICLIMKFRKIRKGGKVHQ